VDYDLARYPGGKSLKRRWLCAQYRNPFHGSDCHLDGYSVCWIFGFEMTPVLNFHLGPGKKIDLRRKKEQ
jgi:hypothetical protein